MYEELVKKLRRCGKGLCTEDCPDWTKNNLYHTCQDEVVLEAADAIEELSRKYKSIAASLNESVELVRKLQQPRWIPVSERLPEDSGDYLVHDSCGNIFQNFFGTVVKRWSARDGMITHWMPLPDPPEEEA